jgi:DNA-binding NarL/FixJ family response regulator
MLVVEDNEDIRFLLNVIVDLHPEMHLDGVANDAEEGLRLWRELQPSLVILDYRLPGRDGLELAAEILAERPDQRIVLFSAYLDDRTVERAEELGIRECISKDHINRLVELLEAR